MQPIPKLWRLGTEQKCKHTKKVKMKLKRTLQLAVLFVTISLGSMAFGQESEWQLVQSKDGIEIYWQNIDCTYHESLKPAVHANLKVVNTTDMDKTIQYNFGLQYEEACSGCGNDSEFSYSLTIPQNSELIGDCYNQIEGLNRVISNPNLQGGWEFKSISISSVTVH